MRSTALQHILACLEPHADGTGKTRLLAGGVLHRPGPPRDPRWLASVYHSLSYGVRKGVKTIALVSELVHVRGCDHADAAGIGQGVQEGGHV